MSVKKRFVKIFDIFFLFKTSPHHGFVISIFDGGHSIYHILSFYSKPLPPRFARGFEELESPRLAKGFSSPSPLNPLPESRTTITLKIVKF